MKNMKMIGSSEMQQDFTPKHTRRKHCSVSKHLSKKSTKYYSTFSAAKRVIDVVYLHMNKQFKGMTCYHGAVFFYRPHHSSYQKSMAISCIFPFFPMVQRGINLGHHFSRLKALGPAKATATALEDLQGLVAGTPATLGNGYGNGHDKWQWVYNII